MSDSFLTRLQQMLAPPTPTLGDLAQYQHPMAEIPSVPVRIGRGLMDVWEPIMQSYLNVTDPQTAAAYQQQRAANERLYDLGLLGAPIDPQATAQGLLANGDPIPSPASLQQGDGARMLGRTLPMGFLGAGLAPAELAMSGMLTSDLYDTINAVRQKLGVAPWLELPQVWR